MYKAIRIPGPIINGMPTPRANAQACIFRSLTAVSEETGKIIVSGSFFDYKEVPEWGVEYKKSSATTWTKVKDEVSSRGTASLTLTGLDAGVKYDVVLYFIVDGLKYQFGDVVSCTVAEAPSE